MIARDEDHHGIRVPLQYMKKSHANRNTSAAVEGLRDDARVVDVPQFFAIVEFVGLCHDEQLSVNLKERFEARSRLGKKTLFTDDRAKLLWPRIACDR